MKLIRHQFDRAEFQNRVMELERKHVCVLGAGIIGLSVATHLLEVYPNHLDVTIVADCVTPETMASDRTGGLFIPPRTIDPCPDVVTAKRWTLGSLRHFERLVDKHGGETVGIKRAKGCYIPLPSQTTIWWSDLFPDFHKASSNEFSHINLPNNTIVYSFTSYIVDGTVHLSWLLNRFRLLGGNVRKQFVNNLRELSHADIIVNCTGLGARYLVNDTQVYPSKGHLLSVNAPWIKEWVHCSSAYIYTRNNDIVLGTTGEIGKEDLEVSKLCIQRMLEKCTAVLPSLDRVHINKYWAGVRPMRANGVRLEKENLGAGDDQIVIHCYGHGSYGVTLSWGCAEHVSDIVRECIGIEKKCSMLLAKI